MAVPTTIFPVAEREIFIIKEATAATIPSTVGVAVPLTTFKPSDKPMWLDDESWQGNMGDLQGVYQGPLIGGLDIGGDVFGDVLGHFIYNLMGDYLSSGTAASPASTLNGGVSAGASSITLTSGTSVTANMYMQIGTGLTAEIVQINSIGSSPTFSLISPLRFAHLTGAAVTNTTAPYTHVFSLLNGSRRGGERLGAGTDAHHHRPDRHPRDRLRPPVRLLLRPGTHVHRQLREAHRLDVQDHQPDRRHRR